MSTDHPFLESSSLIRWKFLTPERVQPDTSHALTLAQEKLDQLSKIDISDPKNLKFSSILGSLETATRELDRAWNKVSHLDSVSNSPDLRKVYKEMLPQVTEFYTKIPLNEELWKVICTYSESEEAKSDALSPVQRRFLEETVRDFEDNGANLPNEKKLRLSELQKTLAEKTQVYSENVLDSTNAFEWIVPEEEMSLLKGLPQTAIDVARNNAKEKGHENSLRFSLHIPSYLPIMKFVHDESVRKRMWEAFTSIGCKDPHDNTNLIGEILSLRKEMSVLLGKDNFADHILQRRMVKSGHRALSFVEDLYDRIFKYYEEEQTQLKKYKSKILSVGEDELLEPWDMAYYQERQRKDLYDLDEEQLRPYFPISSVLSGMFKITESIYGITIREVEVEDECKWHEDVKVYEVADKATAMKLGIFYADWHPRESKRGGAWMHDLVTGNPKEGELHVGVICGNLTPASGDSPALLTHDEVQTIFHEFGHLTHHLMGEVEIPSLNGIHIAWDAVELPSQLLENWTWERESLDVFARHYETEASIPSDLLDKMHKARNYLSASVFMRQLLFGKMDLELHFKYDDHNVSELIESGKFESYLKEMMKSYYPETKTPAPTIITRFGHLFSSPVGYAAAYYSYKWAEVLDADVFSKFKKENAILNDEVGMMFRKKFLSRGNSVDALELFRDFMGRDPDLNALLERDGLLEK